MRRADVFPIDPMRILVGKLGFANHVMSNLGLTKWLHRTLPYRRLQDAEIPVTVTATDAINGDPVYFDSGPALPPLVASCSIPGLFPPVRYGERWLVDGGPAAFMPISRAVAQGAERVYVLPCTGTRPLGISERKWSLAALTALRAPKKPPKSISGINEVALGAAMGTASKLDMRLNSARCELFLLPAPSVVGLSPYSFEHAGALIDFSWDLVRNWLPNAEPVSAKVVEAASNLMVGDTALEQPAELASS
jgi:NTE family protein